MEEENLRFSSSISLKSGNAGFILLFISTYGAQPHTLSGCHSAANLQRMTQHGQAILHGGQCYQDIVGGHIAHMADAENHILHDLALTTSQFHTKAFARNLAER